MPGSNYYGINKWGEQIYANPYEIGNIAQDEFAAEKPQDAVRDSFAQIGHTNQLTNPWVKHFYEDIAPGANMLWMAQTGNGQSAQGAYDYLRRLVNASTGGWGGQNRMAGAGVAASGGAGSQWLDLNQMRNLAQQMARGQSPQAFTDYLGAMDSEQQAQALRQFFGSASSMAMNPMARQALLSTLGQNYSDYKSQIGAGETDTGKFMDYLKGSGWFSRWFG